MTLLQYIFFSGKHFIGLIIDEKNDLLLIYDGFFSFENYCLKVVSLICQVIVK